MQDVTPKEKWSGRKPQVSHFKVFGSVAYTLNPNEKRSKLDAKCMKLMFLGYSERAKAYRLTDVATNKVVVIRI